MSTKYTRGVGRWIKATPYVLVMLVCLFVGLFFLFKSKPSGFIPTEDEGRFFVTYEMPEATSTTRSVAMLDTIMARLLKMPQVKAVGGVAGLNVISFSNKSNMGTVFVSLKDWDLRKDKKDHVQSVIGQIMGGMSDLKEARVLAHCTAGYPRSWSNSRFHF